jgi:hypothetical protein
MGGVVNIVGLKVGQVYNSSAGEKGRNELSNKTDPNDLAPAISESEHPRLNPKVPSFLKYVLPTSVTSPPSFLFPGSLAMCWHHPLS